MSKETPCLGSQKWAEHVFSTPSVRKLRGHSKHTQYHETWVASAGRLMGVQGRLEHVALLLLEYLNKLGLVGRFKEQPFKTRSIEFNAEIVPDFIAEEKRHGRLLVIEIKTARFVTRLVQKQLDLNHEKFATFGLSYLAWTDKHPLTRQTRHNLISMRRCANAVPTSEQDLLVNFLANADTIYLVDAYRAGFDLECIFAAGWAGKVFFSIFDELTPSSLLSLTILDDLTGFFLETRDSLDSWWSTLEKC